MFLIPEEIRNALNQNESFVFLVKGKAGTGKTTLALEILGVMKNPLYISTRITPKLLYKHFSWVKNALPEESIIDATTFDLDQILSAEMEPEFLKSIQLQSFPDFVRVLFSKINSAQTGTLVIDSWNAIATLGETNWGKSNDLLANYILELIRQKNFNLIIVEETEQETYLDYLVDGIVTLYKKFVEDGRPIRQLQLNKLRGSPIIYPIYLFTLDKGRFSTMLPTPIHDIFPSDKIQTIENQQNRFSTGILDLDNVIDGGFIPGTATLNEVHPYLGRIHAYILLRMVFQFLKQNRCVLAIPPPGKSYSDLVEFIQKVVGDANFKRGFRYAIAEQDLELPPNTVRITPSTPKEFFNTVLKLFADFKTSSPKDPNLLIVTVESIPFQSDLNELIKELRIFVNRMKKTNHILIFTTYTGNPLIQTIKNEVFNHLFLTEITGKVVIYPKNRLTNLFALNFKNPENEYRIDLIPLV